MLEPDFFDKLVDISKLKTLITQSFVFSYVWAIGGNVIDTSREPFELFVQDQIKGNPDMK